MKLLDFLGRIALLILSGSATLALIGAIAQVADTAPGGPPPGDRIVAESVVSDPVAVEPRAPIGADADVAQPPPLPDLAVAPAAQAAADRETARWLKSLTYAVMALAGFAAAALLVLLRIAASLSRIADR